MDDKIWKGLSGTVLKEREKETIIKGLVKNYKKQDRNGVLETMDFAPTG